MRKVLIRKVLVLNTFLFCVESSLRLHPNRMDLLDFTWPGLKMEADLEYFMLETQKTGMFHGFSLCPMLR